MALFSRRHYQALASAIHKATKAEQFEYTSTEGISETTSQIADMLAEDNPLFDRNRFYDAIWPEGAGG